MRRATAAVIGIAIALATGRAPSAHACPRTARAASCFTLDGLTFDHVGHALTVIPVADVTATGATLEEAEHRAQRAADDLGL